jgi:hypothetical protein
MEKKEITIQWSKRASKSLESIIDGEQQVNRKVVKE